jgi:nucleotide-binding universal stress UspA family protein
MNFAVTRILVPVDFSPHSGRALRYARALAARLGASVEVLHVLEDPVATDTAARHLEEWATGGYDDLPVARTVRSGAAAPAIIEHAGTIGADLVVMGTHGRTGMNDLFMGSVAGRVVEHAPCPVLTLCDVTSQSRMDSRRVADHPAFGAVLGRHGSSRE